MISRITETERRSKKHNIYMLIVWNIILLTLIFMIEGNAFGQYQKPPPKISILVKDWSININGGKTSFFGDVSLYDDEFSEKLSKEGDYGYGVILSRKITPVFGLDGQLLFCTLRGSNSRSQFSTDIMEYSINLTFNIVNLLLPDNDARFFVYGKFGLGQFQFKSKLVYDDPDKEDKVVESSSPEVLTLFGGGVYYKISNSFNVNAEIAARLVDSDKLDGTTNNKDNDYYTYLSFGITYKINNTPRDTRYYKRMGMRSPLIRRR